MSIIQFWSAIKHAALLIRYILCGDIFDLNKICGSAAVLYNEL